MQRNFHFSYLLWVGGGGGGGGAVLYIVQEFQGEQLLVLVRFEESSIGKWVYNVRLYTVVNVSINHGCDLVKANRNKNVTVFWCYFSSPGHVSRMGTYLC